MADQLVDDGPAAPAAAGEVIHNSVLIRTHEPPRESHSWVAPTLLGVAVVTGAIIWGVMATHPSGPVVNHAVASAPTSFAPNSPG
jgi:hypothetical protein